MDERDLLALLPALGGFHARFARFFARSGPGWTVRPA